jgi:hypothetical protein
MPFDSEFPFKAQLIQPDDAPLLPGGEIDLPADLAALAEQLGDDAAHLARRYPADRAPAVALSAELIESAARIKRRSRSRVAMLAGVSLASVALVAISVAVGLQDRRGPMPKRDSLVASPPALLPASGLEAPELSPLPVTHAAAGTLSVGELSGPEMEALLDLLNSEPKSVASISF